MPGATGTDHRRGRSTAAVGLRSAVIALSVVALVIWSGPVGGAKESTKPATTKKAAKKAAAKKAATKKQAAVLARLKVMGPVVSVKPAGKKTFVTAKDNQVLRQGDSIKTDTAGLAEIDYTDGSLTRLGNATRFTLTTLTNKQGGRQTKGTLGVGQTWNRAAEVAETGSFEVTAGGATAAVEGTAFSYACHKVASQLVCEVVDVVDNVKVVASNGAVTPLGPATTVPLTDGVPSGDVAELSFEDLASNSFIANNVTLDYFTGKGAGFDEFPAPIVIAPRRTAPTTLPPPETNLPPATTLPPTTLPPTTAPPTTTTLPPCNSPPCDQP